MQCPHCAEEVRNEAKKCPHCHEWIVEPLDERPLNKDAWEKWEVIGRVVSILLIPIVIAILGNTVNTSLKKSDIDLRLIEMAVDVLKSPPSGEDSREVELREWAVDVINARLDVKMSEQAKERLLTAPSVSFLYGGFPNSECEKLMPVENEELRQLMMASTIKSIRNLAEKIDDNSVLELVVEILCPISVLY